MAITDKFDIVIPPQDIGAHHDCLKRIADGDIGSFEWLYKNYCRKLYDYAFLLSADEVLSEDVVQDVFLKIWVKREFLSHVKNFNAYAYSMVKHKVLNSFNKKELEKKYLTEAAYLLVQHISTNPLEEKETKRLIQEAVSSLTERQKLFYQLIKEEEISRKEISKAFNISTNTVKNTIIQATRRLKEYIEQKASAN